MLQLYYFFQSVQNAKCLCRLFSKDIQFLYFVPSSQFYRAAMQLNFDDKAQI